VPVGTHGEISYHVAKSGSHIARTFSRDADGVTRQVQRTGPTQAAARNNLLSSLRERRHNTGSTGLSAESSFREAADLWLAGVVHAADVGDLSPNTAQLYELQLRTTSCRLGLPPAARDPRRPAAR
jgi:hypothetical protein